MLDLKTEIAAPRSGAAANPTVIFEALKRYQHTMALKGAIDLELFTHIAAGANTAAAILNAANRPNSESEFSVTFSRFRAFSSNLAATTA